MRPRRYACVWLPNWPAHRLMRRPGGAPPEPFVVALTERQRRQVLAVSPQVAAAGITPGTSVAMAQASLGGLTVVNADLPADKSALKRLAIWALRYTPLANTYGADGLALDIGGADHLFGGEAALLSDLLSRLRQAKMPARGVVSDSLLLSWGVARYGAGADGPGLVIPPGEAKAAAASLPVDALSLEGRVAAALKRLGLDRVETLCAAPRKGLGRRFGQFLLDQIDRLHADLPEVFAPVEVAQLPHSKMVFADPIGHSKGVEGALKSLAAELSLTLERQGKGARRFDLRCGRVDGEVFVLSVSAAAATRDPAHIERLFRERIEKIDPGYGIERLALVAPIVDKLGARQRSADDGDHPDLAPLVDRLTARIGEGRIYHLTPTEADLPERSLQAVPPLSPMSALSWDRNGRPAHLIDPPERVDVVALLPDNPPARFIWRGRAHRIRRADGPECMFGEWWRADEEVALTRDYYRVEDEAGGRYWIFRARDEAAATVQWFLHGVFA